MDLRAIAPQVAAAAPPGAIIRLQLPPDPLPPHEEGFCTGCGQPSKRLAVCPYPPCRGVDCPYCSPCHCADRQAVEAAFGGYDDDEDDFDDAAEDEDAEDDEDEDDFEEWDEDDDDLDSEDDEDDDLDEDEDDDEDD